jgi:protease PrsW
LIAAVLVLFLISGLLLALALGSELGLQAAGVAALTALLPLGIVVPALLWLDRYESEPIRYLGFAFGWGALVATTVSLVLNTGSLAVLQAVTAEGEAVAIVVVAPVVEESLKTLGVLLILWFRRNEFDGVIDGIVYAGLSAAGFAFAENILYFGQAFLEGGGEGLVGVFVVRGILGPFAHPVFTCAAGVAIGWGCRRRGVWAQTVVPLLGLIVAMLLHAGWNLSAVIGLDGFVARYLALQVPVFVVGVGYALWARRREGQLIGRHLAGYAGHGWLSGPEVVMLASLPQRREARRWALAHGGRPALAAMRRFQDTATELALLRERMQHGTARPDARVAEREALQAMGDYRRAFLPGQPSPVRN